MLEYNKALQIASQKIVNIDKFLCIVKIIANVFLLAKC